MKILYLIDSLGSGGAQRQLVELVKHLNHETFQPTICTYYPADFFKANLAGVPVAYRYIPKRSKYDPTIVIKLANLIRREQYDVIHAYLHTPNFYAELAGTLSRIPRIVISERELDIYNFRTTIWRKWLFHRLSDAIIVNSSAIRDNLVEVAGVQPDKIHIVYNGIDTTYFAPQPEESVRDMRRRHNLDEVFVILLVGRLTYVKNHLCLLRAIHSLRQRISTPVRCVFVGRTDDGATMTDVKAYIAQHDLDDCVQFWGPRNDLPDLYNMSDVTVLPSFWEGCPNALLESMACGRPVIASAVSDNPLIVTQGENGFLFNSDDAEAFAEALHALMTLSPSERKEMGAAGQHTVRDRFSIERLVSATTRLYS